MNIPDCFSYSKNILFAGIGGGFDIFTAIPLWVNLRENKQCIFSNYNPLAKEFTDNPATYPESQLSLNLKFVYVLPKVGVKTATDMYQKIIDEHNIDTVVAIDGGVDSLMRGDEEGAGTFLEDTVNLLALNQTKVSQKFLVCAGLGAELEEGLCHHHVLENIATLIKHNAFIGSCSLVKNTEEFDVYKSICEKCWANGRKSHIQTKIISSVLGNFGDTNVYDGIDANVLDSSPKSYILPFMGMYWFFHLHHVVNENVLRFNLASTITKTDVMVIYRQQIDKIKLRPRKGVPL